MKNPVQQAEPNALLVTLKLLLLVPLNSGPDSVSVDGLAADRDFRKVIKPPDVSRLTPSNDNNGLPPVLATVALSPMNMKECVFVVGSPFLSVAFTALRRGPARLTEGGSCRVPEANEKKPPPCPGGTAVPAVAEPPLMERRAPPPAPVRDAPLKTPRISCPLEIEEFTALSSGP
jgi:hypothetical protein